MGSCWKSSTDPSDDSEVDEADAVGESSGEPAVELVAVEGIESIVIWRLSADCCGIAVVLIFERLQCKEEENVAHFVKKLEQSNKALELNSDVVERKPWRWERSG